MDPISIAGACFAISKIVYTNIKRCREIDETLDALAADQKELAKTIRLFQSELSQETFNTGKEQWQTLQSSLNGLSTTMKSLENILTEIRGVELGAASRPVQVIRLQMKNEDIDAIKRRIEAYTRAIQLSVQFITLSSMRKIEANTSDLSGKLDTTIFLISRFLELVPISSQFPNSIEPPEPSSPIAPAKIDLDSWTTLAGKLVSSSETLDAPNARLSKFDPESQLADVNSFFQECWNDQEEEYLRELKQLPWRSPLDHPDHKFIQFLRTRAVEAFDAKNYRVAKMSLQKILVRASKMYGPLFQGRDETLRMLVICSVKLGDWEDADKYMRTQFKQRDETMEDLAMDLFLHGKRDDAAKICLGGEEGKKFVGREAIMDLLVASYMKDRTWAQAKRILSDLLFTEQPEDYIRLQRVHNLAFVYFHLREYESAKSCAKAVFEERAKRFGESHISCFQSAGLLVQICEKNGDADEAAFYKTLLESDTHTIAEIEQLCTIAGDGVNPSTESSGKLGRKASIGKILRSKSFDSGIDRAVNELGKTILKDCFRPSGLKLMKKTMKKNNCIIGPGDGYSLLHAFAKRGRTSVVEYILAKGADPNARDNFNLTPLLRAVMEEHYEMANLLIKRGADYEATFEGNSCLIEATLQNNDALVRLLLDSGAFIEAKTKDGHTALHLAAANAYVNVVQILLQYGANVNTRDNKQMTPLMAAALRNKYWMVHLLLVMGADVGARDKDGETALELHQNKAASKILCLNQLYDMRDTPVARLLQSEMIRQRRISQGDGDLSITPGLEKLELEFE